MDPTDRDSWRHELYATGAWVRRTPPVRMLAPALGCLAFTAICVGFLVVDAGVVRAIGVIGILVFGVWFLPTTVWRAVTGKPELRLDRTGIAVEPCILPWSEVSGVGFYGSGGSRTVLVRLTPAGLVRRRQQGNAAGRFLRRLSDRLAGGPSLGIANGYGIPPDELADWIEEVRRQATGGG